MKTILSFLSLFFCGLFAAHSLFAAETLEVPQISNFQQISPQDGTFSFSAIYPKDAIAAAKEFNTKANADNPIRIVAEIKIEDYEWQSCRVHSADLLEENKTFDSEIARKLQSEGTVQLRIKIIDNKEQFPETDWSNVLAINATGPESDYVQTAGTDESVSEESAEGAMPAAKSKKTRNAKKGSGITQNQSCLLNSEKCCKQILGLSVCVWQSIAALIFIILLIIYRKIAMFALIIVILAVLFIVLRHNSNDGSKKNDISAEKTAVQIEKTAE